MRNALQQAIAQSKAGQPKGVAELRKDVIEPQLEDLQRTFRKIKVASKYKVGAAVLGSLGLALSAIYVAATSGAGATSGIVSGLLGAGGFGGLAQIVKEYGEYKTKVQELKDHPFYLFWKARQRH